MKENITGNEPATGYGFQIQEGLVTENYTGLTIRQYFAATAMQGMLSNSIAGSHRNFNQLAKESVMYADALIAELNK